MQIHKLPFDQEEATLTQIQQGFPSQDQLEFISRTFQAMADPIRCKIILALRCCELCVSDLAQITGVSVSRVSHNLKGLRGNRLVRSRREGNTIYYSIDDAHVGNLFIEVISHLDHVYHDLPNHP